MKHKLWKCLIFAMLFCGIVIGATRTTASATAIDKQNVIIDYENETAIVKSDQDEIIYFTENYNKDVSRWDACEVREKTNADGSKTRAAYFDISWINDNKTVRLYICGDVNTDVVSVDIIWEEDFSVQFTGTLLATDITEAEKWKQVYKNYPYFSEDTGYFIFTREVEGRDQSYFNVQNIQWRKGDDGVWRNFSELDLKEMNIRGINLEFRIVADNTNGARVSSTAKISVAKLNSSPNVLVNTDTMTVGLKNNMEFSFDKETWTLIPAYNKKFGTEEYLIDQTDREKAIEAFYTNKKISSVMMQQLLKTQVSTFTTNTPMNYDNLLELSQKNNNAFECTDEGVVLYVRDIGTDRKAASKITEVLIPYASKDTAIPPESGATGEKTLEISYGDSKTNTGGIVFDNKTDYKYQVGVITAEDAAKLTNADWQDLDLSGVKWTSIKSGKMMKISNKKVPKDSYILYRIAGEDGQLPSSYRIYGPMKYDHLTYSGIAKATMAAGQTLTAVPSTNFVPKADGTYENLTFQWQSCTDVKAKEPVWNDIAGATGPTYKLTNDLANQYIRVAISDKLGHTKYSDYEGPVKEVKEKEPAGGGTPTPTPTP